MATSRQLAILIPTLGRADKLAGVVSNILDSGVPRNTRIIFIGEAHDEETIAECRNLKATLILNQRSPSYAGAINTAVKATTVDAFFIGSDDLNFHHGWYQKAEVWLDYFGVVGSNDLANFEVLRGDHATHYLVTYEYAMQGSIDNPDQMLHEGYTHNWVDTEFIATAKFRNQYTPCLESVVEHNHPTWGKATMDATYAKGFDSESKDAHTFRERQHLWT